MVSTKKQLAPTRPMVNGYGYGNNRKFLTIHQTGNTNKGANAQMHADLQSRVYGASWHWQVDDKEAIQSFEHTYRCWHASDGRGDGNSNSIGIEGCINSDGNYVQSVKNMAELAAKILKDEGIPIENMRQHHDFDTKNRKNCPAQIRAGKDGINWNDFVRMVKDNMKGNVVREPVKTPVTAKPKPKPQTKSIETLVAETKAGKHGNGDARKKSLGSNYNAVMDIINGKNKPKAVTKKFNLPDTEYWVKKPQFSGSGVLVVQNALSSIYFYPNKGAKNNGCDSYYGPKTADAVKRFQSVHGLKADGIYGDSTRKKLDSLVNK